MNKKKRKKQFIETFHDLRHGKRSPDAEVNERTRNKKNHH
jgi:hypothetical protein